MRQYLKKTIERSLVKPRGFFVLLPVVKESSSSLRRLNGVLASKKSAELFLERHPLAAEQIQLPVNLTLKTTLDEILYNLFHGLLDVGLCSLTDFSFREILY